MVAEVLDHLSDRHKNVLIKRFGIGCNVHSLDDIGMEYKVCRERVRQIEAKALRKMRHPTRSKQLQAFLDLLEGE